MYEYSNRLTIGGPNGTYFVASPWNGPCEWAVVGVCFTGKGGLVVSDIASATGGPDVSAATVTFSDPYGGAVFQAAAAAMLTPDAIFTPLPGNKLMVTTSGLTASAALATVVFRRPAVIDTQFPALLHVSPDDEEQYHRMVAAHAADEAAAERAEVAALNSPHNPAQRRQEVTHGR